MLKNYSTKEICGRKTQQKKHWAIILIDETDRESLPLFVKMCRMHIFQYMICFQVLHHFSVDGRTAHGAFRSSTSDFVMMMMMNSAFAPLWAYKGSAFVS